MTVFLPKLKTAAVVLTLLAAVAPGLASTAVDVCGQLVQVGSCVLLSVSGEGDYVLSATAAFVPGDNVRVIGSLEGSCSSSCSNYAGCITVGDITYCDGPVSVVGTLTATSGCIILADERDQLIAIDNVGTVAVGTRVIVSGEFSRRCEPRCSGIRRCIRNNSVVEAPLPPTPPPDTGGGSSNGGTTGGTGGAGGDGGNGQTGNTGGSGSNGSTGGGSNGGTTSGDGSSGGSGNSGSGNSNPDDATDPLGDELATMLCPALGFAVPGLALLGIVRTRRRM